MKEQSRLLSRRLTSCSLGGVLIVFLFSSSLAFSFDKGRKNEVTASFGLFYDASLTLKLFTPQETRPSFSVGFERRLSKRYSIAVSFIYAIPSRWLDYFENSIEASEKFYYELGGSRDSTKILEERSAFILDVGFYTYFKSRNKGELFLYFGSGMMRVIERYRFIDHKASLDERFSFSKQIGTVIDLGFGYKYELDERCSVRAEWRMHSFIAPFVGGDPWYDNFFIGLSYRF
ncbi:MAG: hypothetical protein J7L64_09175 [Acidobacteria bacterium]|nr:hypothetical protein [Acidobacteriota bacterium]